MISAEVIIPIQFYDLDPMRIVWHGNYPRFLEQARAASGSRYADTIGLIKHVSFINHCTPSDVRDVSGDG